MRDCQQGNISNVYVAKNIDNAAGSFESLAENE
jgi:hypothetical protein